MLITENDIDKISLTSTIDYGGSGGNQLIHIWVSRIILGLRMPFLVNWVVLASSEQTKAGVRSTSIVKS